MGRKGVIWRAFGLFANIGNDRKNFSGWEKLFSDRPSGRACEFEVRAVIYDSNCVEEGFEISSRFRRTLEERIARLESDAECDEALIEQLVNADHVRRQRRLVAAERAEALRMRIFLDRCGSREPWTVSSGG